MRRHVLVCVGSAIVAGTSLSADAALLSGTVDTSTDGTASADLTALGTVDWAIWANTASGNVTPYPIRYSKAGGTAGFSSIAPVGAGASTRGGNTATTAFSFSDGTAPTTSLSSTSTLGLIFNSGLETVGNGVQFTVGGDVNTERQIRVWGAGFDGRGTFVASLNGAPDVTLLSQTYASNNPKLNTLFTINYKPDNPTDLLTLRYTLTTNGTGSNAHVGFQAAAVSEIPEPGSVATLAAGGLLLAVRRRRKR